MKRIFKWLLRLFFAAILLAVVGLITLLLTYNSILRMAMERQIRAQTGMNAEIGGMNVALMSPTIKIQNFKLYNSSDFGGAPFLVIPEIYVEYDRPALAKKEIHITLMRFNLGEMDIVKNQAGQTNIFALGIKLPSKKSGGGQATVNFKKQTGYDFTGIDALNVSVGKLKYIDLNDPQNNHEQEIGVDNCVTPNVKSRADLAPLVAIIVLHSDGFFDSFMDQKKPGFNVLKQLGL